MQVATWNLSRFFFCRKSRAWALDHVDSTEEADATQVEQVFHLHPRKKTRADSIFESFFFSVQMFRLLIFTIKEKLVRFISSPIVVFKLDVITFSEIVKEVMKYWNLLGSLNFIADLNFWSLLGFITSPSGSQWKSALERLRDEFLKEIRALYFES